MEERFPWHQDPWRQLQQRRNADRLPHALLLTGPAGLGKLAFARRLARALLCARPDAGGDACGDCRGCRLFLTGTHPDFSVARPAEDARRIDGDPLGADEAETGAKGKKSKVIKIDQIRDLCAFLGYTAQYGGYKIALIEPAEHLNGNAANSLLKTLEEPPGASLLLLVTAQPARLPATVRSRCQALRFSPPPATVTVPWLAARVADGPDPATLLDLAGGSPLAALAHADAERWRRRQDLAERYEQVLAGRIDPVRVAESWMQGDWAENLRWLIGWHVDLIRLKMMADPPRLGNPDLCSILRRWAGGLTPRILFERLDAAVRLHTLCTTTQANVQLLLEAFLGDSAPGDESGISRTRNTEA